MRNALPRAAALLLPLMLLAGAARWLTSTASRETPALVVATRDVLKRTNPGIVILGNSKASADLDRKALRTALGYTPQIAVTNVAASGAPTWYAMLEQQVFNAGYEPELVIVYGQFGALLRTEAPYAFERKTIEDLLEGPSPVLEAKVLGDVSSLTARARNRATQAHTDLLNAIRNYAVGLTLVEDRSAGLAAAGAAVAQPALDKLLGANARFLKREAARVVPVVDREQRGAMTAGDSTPEDSLIADFIQLAAQHDARVVFVRAPLAPGIARGDSVTPEVERQALAIMAAGNASWVDLHALELPPNAFRDDYHAGPVGRTIITQALADAMKGARILEGGVAEAEPPLTPSSVTRVGTPPIIPAAAFEPVPGLACAFVSRIPAMALYVAEDFLAANNFPKATPLVASDASGARLPRAPNAGFGTACSGGWQHRRSGALVSPLSGTPEGITLSWAPEVSVQAENGDPVWWVYPGTATKWQFDERPKQGNVRVTVEARAIKGSSGTLKVGGVAVSLEPVGRQLRASLDVDVGSTWDIQIEAARDTWLMIDDLVFGDEPPRQLVASPVVSVSPLFHRRKSVTDVPAIPQGASPTPDGPRVRIHLPELAEIADDVFEARIGRRCSPIQLMAGDQVIAEAHTSEKQVAMRERRGYAHLADALLLALPSARMPEGPYALRLDPGRHCNAATWLYPGDVMTWTFGAEPMRRVGLPPDRLIVDGIAAAGSSPTPLRVVMKDNRGREIYNADVELPTTGGAVRRCLPIDPPIRVGVALTFELHNPVPEGVPVDEASWYLLDRVQLADAEHAEGCAP